MLCMAILQISATINKNWLSLFNTTFHNFFQSAANETYKELQAAENVFLDQLRSFLDNTVAQKTL